MVRVDILGGQVIQIFNLDDAKHELEVLPIYLPFLELILGVKNNQMQVKLLLGDSLFQATSQGTIVVTEDVVWVLNLTLRDDV